MPKTYTPIATQTLTSTASDITFSNISGSYTDLVAIVKTNTTGDLRLRINSDTGSNYSQTAIYGYSSFGSTRSSNSTYHWLNYGGNNGNFLAIVHLNNYSNTNTFKSSIVRDSANGTVTDIMAGLWRNTAAITSLTFLPSSGSLQIGSTFTLYGILKA